MSDHALPTLSLDPKQNRLLAQLEPDVYRALKKEAKIVSFKLRKRVLLQDEQVPAVYFPLTCMFSLIVTHSGQPELELATIGNEGVVGATEALQSQTGAGLALIQIPGTALRLESTLFRKLAEGSPQFRKLIDGHTYALMRQILFGAACNRVHTMEERCARWLLMTQDRASGNAFPLTQEFLSHMLAVRRATVNVSIGVLKKAGYIHYVRGRITVVDRPGLESAACDCYQSIVKAYASILPV